MKAIICALVFTMYISTASGSSRFTVNGDCDVNADCVMSSNYPGSHSTNNQCTVTVSLDSSVKLAPTFVVETCCDHLIVDGTDVDSHGQMPASLNAGDTITWSSDNSINNLGWMICFDAPGATMQISAAARFVVNGDCDVNGECISSKNWPAQHGNDNTCAVTTLDSGYLIPDSNFQVQSCCDNLIIGGVDVEAVAQVPASINQGDTFTWTTDSSTTSTGWKICTSITTSERFSVTGRCDSVGDCVSSKNYPQPYGNHESCLITALMDSVLTPGSTFDVETCCDNLMIGGVDVHAVNQIPSSINQGESFTWSTDGSVLKVGWQICFSDPNPGPSCASNEYNNSGTCTTCTVCQYGDTTACSANADAVCNPPPPVHGDWSAWGSCSITCRPPNVANGVRNRACDNPAPEHNGNPCAGNAVDGCDPIPPACPTGCLSSPCAQICTTVGPTGYECSCNLQTHYVTNAVTGECTRLPDCKNDNRYPVTSECLDTYDQPVAVGHYFWNNLSKTTPRNSLYSLCPGGWPLLSNGCCPGTEQCPTNCAGRSKDSGTGACTCTDCGLPQCEETVEKAGGLSSPCSCYGTLCAANKWCYGGSCRETKRSDALAAGDATLGCGCGCCTEGGSSGAQSIAADGNGIVRGCEYSDEHPDGWKCKCASDFILDYDQAYCTSQACLTRTYPDKMFCGNDVFCGAGSACRTKWLDKFDFVLQEAAIDHVARQMDKHAVGNPILKIHDWGTTCSLTCGGGVITRQVDWMDFGGDATLEAETKALWSIETEQACNTEPCNPCSGGSTADCVQACRTLHGGDGMAYECYCTTPGMELAGDGKSCKLIDLCDDDDRGGCDQICTCTDGINKQCSCYSGWTVDTNDPTKCVMVNPCDTANGGCPDLCTFTGIANDAAVCVCSDQDEIYRPANNQCEPKTQCEKLDCHHDCDVNGPTCICRAGYTLQTITNQCVLDTVLAATTGRRQLDEVAVGQTSKEDFLTVVMSIYDYPHDGSTAPAQGPDYVTRDYAVLDCDDTASRVKYTGSTLFPNGDLTITLNECVEPGNGSPSYKYRCVENNWIQKTFYTSGQMCHEDHEDSNTAVVNYHKDKCMVGSKALMISWPDPTCSETAVYVLNVQHYQTTNCEDTPTAIDPIRITYLDNAGACQAGDNESVMVTCTASKMLRIVRYQETGGVCTTEKRTDTYPYHSCANQAIATWQGACQPMKCSTGGRDNGLYECVDTSKKLIWNADATTCPDTGCTDTICCETPRACQVPAGTDIKVEGTVFTDGSEVLLSCVYGKKVHTYAPWEPTLTPCKDDASNVCQKHKFTCDNGVWRDNNGAKHHIHEATCYTDPCLTKGCAQQCNSTPPDDAVNLANVAASTTGYPVCSCYEGFYLSGDTACVTCEMVEMPAGRACANAGDFVLVQSTSWTDCKTQCRTSETCNFAEYDTAHATPCSHLNICTGIVDESATNTIAMKSCTGLTTLHQQTGCYEAGCTENDGNICSFCKTHTLNGVEEAMMCCSERYNYAVGHKCKFTDYLETPKTNPYKVPYFQSVPPFQCVVPRAVATLTSVAVVHDNTNFDTRYNTVTVNYNFKHTGVDMYYFSIILRTDYQTPSVEMIAYGHDLHCAHSGTLSASQATSSPSVTLSPATNNGKCQFKPNKEYKTWTVIADLDKYKEIQAQQATFTPADLCQGHDCSDICEPFEWLMNYGCRCNANRVLLKDRKRCEDDPCHNHDCVKHCRSVITENTASKACYCDKGEIVDVQAADCTEATNPKGYAKATASCVTGNIVSNGEVGAVTRRACAEKCTEQTACVAFQYGVQTAGRDASTAQALGTCVLKESAVVGACDGDAHGTDLYTKDSSLTTDTCVLNPRTCTELPDTMTAGTWIEENVRNGICHNYDPGCYANAYKACVGADCSNECYPDDPTDRVFGDFVGTIPQKSARENCRYLCTGYSAYGLEFPVCHHWIDGVKSCMVQCYCGTYDELNHLKNGDADRGHAAIGKLATVNGGNPNCHKVYGGHKAIRVFEDPLGGYYHDFTHRGWTGSYDWKTLADTKCTGMKITYWEDGKKSNAGSNSVTASSNPNCRQTCESYKECEGYTVGPDGICDHWMRGIRTETAAGHTCHVKAGWQRFEVGRGCYPETTNYQLANHVRRFAVKLFPFFQCIDECNWACAKIGFDWFAMQWGIECYCLDTDEKDGLQAEPTQLDVDAKYTGSYPSCSGHGDGGYNNLQVYHTKARQADNIVTCPVGYNPLQQSCWCNGHKTTNHCPPQSFCTWNGMCLNADQFRAHNSCEDRCPVEFPVWDAFDMLCLKGHKRGHRCYLQGVDGCTHTMRLQHQLDEKIKPCVWNSNHWTGTGSVEDAKCPIPLQTATQVQANTDRCHCTDEMPGCKVCHDSTRCAVCHTGYMLHKDTKKCFQPCTAGSNASHCQCVTQANDCVHCAEMHGQTKCDICPITANFAPHWDIKSCVRRAAPGEACTCTNGGVTRAGNKANANAACDCSVQIDETMIPHLRCRDTNRQPIQTAAECQKVANKIGMPYRSSGTGNALKDRVANGCYIYHPTAADYAGANIGDVTKHIGFSTGGQSADDLDTMPVCWNPFDWEEQTWVEYSH